MKPWQIRLLGVGILVTLYGIISAVGVLTEKPDVPFWETWWALQVFMFRGIATATGVIIALLVGVVALFMLITGGEPMAGGDF